MTLLSSSSFAFHSSVLDHFAVFRHIYTYFSPIQLPIQGRYLMLSEVVLSPALFFSFQSPEVSQEALQHASTQSYPHTFPSPTPKKEIALKNKF